MDYIGGALNSFFEPIKKFAHDVELFNNEKDSGIQSLRGAALAIRVGGVAAGIFAAAAVVSGIGALVTLSPAGVIASVAAFTIFALPAHDCFQTASNMEKAIQIMQPKEQTAAERACQSLRAIWEKICPQPETKDPYDFILKDTIVFGTVYHLFNTQPAQPVDHPHTT